MDTKPYYIILLIILVFIFLWFFFGTKEYEFIGLKPLNPDYVIDYPDYTYHDPLHYYPKDDNKPLPLPSLNDESVSDICIDYTPAIPQEFTNNICINNNKKFLSKGEKICRDTMERIYGVHFENQRPTWLRNDKTGKCLELDCYNEKLKLAVEYQGHGHYQWPNHFHKTYAEFKEQLYRDQLKKQLCQKHGVHLIVVPYNIPNPLIPTYIMRHLPEIVQKRLNDEQII
ncbi:MAG TPA: hypothetical protein VLG50_05395 [Candidatus Saccharimonadales bacterium]|nr:hypothetical protein [Candidatus Saccharimonadales bacterium]